MPPLSQLTSCTPTKPNLYIGNSLAAAISQPDLYILLTFQVPNLMPFFHSLGRTKLSVNVRGKRSFNVVCTVYHIAILVHHHERCLIYCITHFGTSNSFETCRTKKRWNKTYLETFSSVWSSTLCKWSCFIKKSGIVNNLSNPQVGGPPLVGCQRLLIQYICCYPQY